MALIGQVFENGPNRLRVVGTYMGFTMCEVLDDADNRKADELVAASKMELAKWMKGGAR